MKNKLYIVGFVSFSLLAYSCSNDDSYEVPEVKSRNIKISPQADFKNELNKKRNDSTTVILNIEIMRVNGDPSNPIPPRAK